ncbi:unnamed protein product [Diatraea saccharalis]|uniref:Uncharacterized protein n=1 Tax=Diatraea saccharalis TaxID=40085 RepID=A0A9N9N0U1_9NEOP|nr:unnamed protein product [Diatraea saccharalis]
MLLERRHSIDKLPTNLLSPRVGKQEYSSRTLGLTWGIISAVMLPIVIVLICVGWRILKKKKEEEKEENDFMTIKSRPIDPDESMKINSDDESIPYKKDIPEESPEPTDPVQIMDSPETSRFPYGQSYNSPEPPPQPPPMELTQSPPMGLQQPSPMSSQPSPMGLSQPSIGLPLPPQSRRWDGETEIN